MPDIKEIEENNKGLFADQEYEVGNIVLFLSGKYLSEPTRTSIQIKGRHLESSEGGYVNHRCEPNTAVISPGVSMPFLSATKNINKGDEITFNYETTEKKLSEPFKCNCHGRWIKGTRDDNNGRTTRN